MKGFFHFFRRLFKYLKTHSVSGLIKRIKDMLKKKDVYAQDGYIIDKTVVEFNPSDYEKHKNDKLLLLNWVIPEMGVGSGGHINIFRFISNLENQGFHSRVYLHNSLSLKDNDSLRKFIKSNFSILDSRVEAFCDIEYMTFAHATIATGWQTAYPVKNFNNTISKFYFVQDFEPYFYPMGSYYAFSENTYNFGFRGITAGDWLKDKLNKEYGMKTDSFGFSYDKDIYTVRKKRSNGKRVFFYARPVTARRDFELGMLTFKLLNDLVEDLTVVFAGWDVSNYDIPFKYENLGVLPIEKLADVYSDCDMCLVISHTNLSLLPLEVMASGSVAVCSKGENSSWLVDDNNSIMVDFEPEKMAEKMAYYLNNPEELDVIRQKGIEFAKNTSWVKEAEKVSEAIRKGIAEDDG